MKTQHSPGIYLSLLAATAVVSVGCASPSTEPASDAPAGPTAVHGQGTVIQTGDDTPQFCLGAIMESYPPQCSGPELVGWDWAAVEGQETAGDVTWGSYAVMGDWDGGRLTVSDAIMLALYDPMPFVDPLLDPDNAGTTSADDLTTVQGDIQNDAPVEILTSRIENGYVFATVVFDDGSIQAWADHAYGAGVVAIRAALSTT